MHAYKHIKCKDMYTLCCRVFVKANHRLAATSSMRQYPKAPQEQQFQLSSNLRNSNGFPEQSIKHQIVQFLIR